MSHNCSTCIVHCMDFRIQKTVENLLASLGVNSGDFDRVAVAGGAADKTQLERHLELSSRLHGPARFILTVHEDCGAGAKMEDLDAALAYALTTFPAARISGFFIKLDGTWLEHATP